MNRIGITLGVAAAVLLAVSIDAMAQSAPAPGWITATNQACKIWNPEPQANESVTWSGGCKDGLASGQGVLRWTENGKPDAEFDGVYAEGKRNGPGTLILPDGSRSKGVWADDEPYVADKNAI